MLKGNSNDRFVLARNSKREEKVDNFIIKNTLSKSTPHKSYNNKSKNSRMYNVLLKTQLISKPNRSLVKNITTNKKPNKNPHALKTHLPKTITSFTKKKTNANLHKKKLLSHLSSPFSDEVLNLSIMTQDSNESFSITDYLSEIDRTKPCLVKVLDAPNLVDDFYLHLMAWSKTDIISVALSNDIYLLNNKTSKVSLLNTFLEEKVCSINFLSFYNILLIGFHSGDILLYDIQKQKEVVRYGCHSNRVSVIETIPLQENLFSSGSKDSQIIVLDNRQKQAPVSIFTGNKQEVCGIKWAPDGKTMASGSNDNNLFIWKLGTDKPYHIFKEAHNSAIRALDWSEKKFNFLCTGGGVQDRCIKLWNCNSMKMIHSFQTESQICNLKFDKNSGDLVSTHGYNDNLINLWTVSNDFTNITHRTSLSGHRNRALYFAASPDNKTIATGSGDETIRIWNVFEGDKKDKRSSIFDKLNIDFR